MYKSKELSSLSDAGLENKEKLDISNNLLESLEGIEKSCKTLTWLNVSHNKLKDIQHIKSCTNLNVLNLSYNKLTTASHISDLKNLKALILNNNELENVESLGELKVLNTLVVSHNQLSNIDVSKFPNLQKFSASHNQLTDIPDFRKQKDIKDVKLNNNSIKKLPLWLPQCKRIKVLDLGNNKLSSYECIKLLGDLPFLENLNLKGNPLCDADDYYTKIKTLLPHLKLLDFKNLSEMYLKELQGKSIIKKTEDENKNKQEIKYNEEPKDRGFVSNNIKIDKKPETNPIEVKKKPKAKKKKDKNDSAKKLKKKNKEISSINSTTSENKVDECQIEKVILDVNTQSSKDSKKRKMDDNIKTIKKKRKGLTETGVKKKKVKSDKTKVADKAKSGIISVKKIKTVNDNKDISSLLKNISNGDNLGSGLASTW